MAELSRDDEQYVCDDANLRAGVADLAGLVASSRPLPEVLAEVAAFAVRAIPGADGVGVALLRAEGTDGTLEACAASAEFAAEIDSIQYVMLGEGPGVTAARHRRVVRSGSLGGDQQWPRFGPRAGRLGVHSALALPLVVTDQVVGAIGVYAHGKNAFDQRAVDLGELFAKPAAVAVHNARILAQALSITDRLEATLRTRPVIDQAVGVILARTGRTAEDALDHLRAVSQAEQRKLPEVARQVVDEAVRRARARGTP